MGKKKQRFDPSIPIDAKQPPRWKKKKGLYATKRGERPRSLAVR
jgi:hypothetical protein